MGQNNGGWQPDCGPGPYALPQSGTGAKHPLSSEQPPTKLQLTMQLAGGERIYCDLQVTSPECITEAIRREPHRRAELLKEYEQELATVSRAASKAIVARLDERGLL